VNGSGRVRSLAIHLGLDPDDVAGRFSYEKVVRVAGEATRLGADLSALVWRLGSGFAHGRYWASMSWLQREVVASKEAGVVNVRPTNDVDQVLVAAQFPVLFTDLALRLYEQRRRSPHAA
jgi:hypothetical protein